MSDDRIKLSDGSSWPRPAMESDDSYGVGHVLRYGNPSRSDLLLAASVIEAYGILVAESSRLRRDFVCREIRAALSKEAPHE